ncbi:MAG: SH3 domain-containing protein [Burkholderiaceae bacterium]
MSIIRNLSIFRVLVAVLLAFSAAAAQAVEMVSVDRPVINMRTGPGTNHEATWRLNRGYPLMIIARKDGWLQVRDFEGDTGWVQGNLTAKKPFFVVKGQDVNIRSGPGTNHPVVGKALYGEVMQTLEHGPGWARVRNGEGLTGWIARSLLWGW